MSANDNDGSDRPTNSLASPATVESGSWDELDPAAVLLARVRATAADSVYLVDAVEDPGFDDITGLAASVTETPMAAIGLVGANRLRFKSRVGWKVGELPRADAFCKRRFGSVWPWLGAIAERFGGLMGVRQRR